MRLISEADVDRLVVPCEAIELATEAFIQQTTGEQPPPGRLDQRRAEPKAGMLVLAGFSAGPLGIVKSNMHAYRGTPAARHTASLLTLWDMAVCKPLALIASAAFNGHRTASGFAAAARMLAPDEASTLTLFGAGHMAVSSIAYMAAVRQISEVIVTSRRLEQAQVFADRMEHSGLFPAIRFSACDDREHAARLADIIVCVTSADAPVFPGAAVRDGAFVVLGGANRPSAREADDMFARRAHIYTDHLAGCLEKAGDIKVPLASGVIAPGDLAGEIGALLCGRSQPPTRDRPIAFKSIGIAPQDIALAKYVYDKAAAADIGAQFDIMTGALKN